jgi:hypothetical protein
MQGQGVYPVAGNWPWVFSRYNGTGDIADGTVVQSFTYTFPAGSADGVSPNVIDGTLIKVGDELT